MDTMLVLGHRGKLGRALAQAFASGWRVEGRGRADGFDANDFAQVRALLQQVRPRIVANAVALGGLAACEEDPAAAFRLNALLPRLLAQCAAEAGFLLMHFSTSAVFDGAREDGAYLENDRPQPLNAYGTTKLAGDCFVQALAPEHYLFRLSVLAGPGSGPPQFVERMLARARAGETLQVAGDITCSPSYAPDIARAVRSVVQARLPHGLYHVANAGSASLWELTDAAVRAFGLDTPVLRVGHQDLPAPAPRPLRTPLSSARLEPLRPWREALRAYAEESR
jgi:dTDP-4-dehydrorhamnose reductase